MTGPEHYAEAERLLTERDAVRAPGAFGAGSMIYGDAAREDMLARAQVHAALAQTAATLVGSASGYTAHRVQQWELALGPAHEPQPWEST